MGLKDIIATVRSSATGIPGRRGKAGDGTGTAGGATGPGAGDRLTDRLRAGIDRARARRAENDPGRRDPDDPDGPVPAGTGPR